MRLVLLLLLSAWLAVAHAQPPAMMLAGSWRDGLDVSAYFVSEKYDGVRARWDGQALWSRNGHRIATPAWFTRDWPAEPMDGELWLGRGRFEQTSALLRRTAQDPAQWRPLRFMVFDLPAHPGPFQQRLASLRQLLAHSAATGLQLAPQRRLGTHTQLQHYLHEVTAGGGEGLMLHHYLNPYRAGRSEGLLKLKPWADAEAVVIAHLPGKGKYLGKLGALMVRTADGRQLRLGSGLSDRDRLHPPPLGSTVTYRYNGYTAKGTPRFARYLRLREDAPGAQSPR